ncbi:retrotransposon protein, putative, ty1-copia subclass, partial [Tanacetum coccineum]
VFNKLRADLFSLLCCDSIGVYRGTCKSHMVLGIAPTAIIDRQLPFEYTITSRSTDVVVIRWEQLERLGYVLPQDLSVGLILNGLTSDFTGFVRNYNMHNMGKTIGELHAMLIEYEKGLLKKAETPQLKNPKPTTKEHPAKDDTCHHCKEVGYWKRNCPVFLAELLKKKKQVGTASSLGIFTIELFSFPNKSWVYDTGCGTHVCITKQGFREARKLKQGALYLYVDNGVRAQVEAIGRISVSKKSTKRAKRNLDSTYLWHCRLAHISKKRIEKLQQEGLLRSTDDELFDHGLGCEALVTRAYGLTNFNRKQNSFCEMLDSESNKWIDAMNAEIQSMIDNMVWVLVDLPPNCKTIESKWIFKKKTDMDGIVHNYKARLVAMGYTQLYGVDSEETFSPVADIKAIRILISIVAFYDYEIWKWMSKLPS